jgi:nitrate reductase NapE
MLLHVRITPEGPLSPHEFTCGEMMKAREPANKKQELRAFLFLTIVTAPVLSVMAVGGYGFCVWILQMLTGRLPGG